MLTESDNIEIENQDEVEKWLHHRIVDLNHKIDALRGKVGDWTINVSYRDTVTGESIQLKFKRGE